jgi:HSP20 family protein
MSVVKWHPVSEMMELGNLLNRSFDGNGLAKPQTRLHLALDVYETEGELVLTASLPGAGREDLEIEFEDRMLTVRGTVKPTELPEGAKSLLSERAHGTVSRTLRIPHHLDVTNSKATFNNGLLEVRLPKAAEARKKTITIE